MTALLFTFQMPETVPFEMLVIDNALHTVISKFNRHLNMIKPIFKVLLEETVASPSDKILRRILAFKKSLISFENNVLFIEVNLNFWSKLGPNWESML